MNTEQEKNKRNKNIQMIVNMDLKTEQNVKSEIHDVQVMPQDTR